MNFNIYKLFEECEIHKLGDEFIFIHSKQKIRMDKINSLMNGSKIEKSIIDHGHLDLEDNLIFFSENDDKILLIYDSDNQHLYNADIEKIGSLATIREDVIEYLNELT